MTAPFTIPAPTTRRPITADFATFRSAVEAAATVASKAAATSPILSHLLISASPQAGLRIVANDQSLYTSLNIGETEATALIAVPAAQLAKWLSTFGKQAAEITLHDHGTNVEIEVLEEHVRFPTLPADDFPMWSSPEPKTVLRGVPVSTLKRLLRVQYALPRKDHRRVLMGIFVEWKYDRLSMTATDGKQLARGCVTLEPSLATGGPWAASVPVSFFQQLLVCSSGSVDLELSESEIRGEVDGIEVAAKTIEGRYPDCNAVLPKQSAGSFEVDAHVLEGALKRADVLVSESKSRAIVLKPDALGMMRYESMSQDNGVGTGILPTKREGEVPEFAVNCQIMRKQASAIGTERIHYRFKSAASPIIVCGVGESGDGEEWTHVLMPIKLSEVRAGGAGGEG